MGGDVGVTSAPGRGSNFWATMRLEEARALGAAPPELPAENALQALQREFVGAVILLVDDNPVNREVATAMLEVANLQVLTAEDGQQCLEVAQSKVVSLVLMDLQMPVLNGIDAAIALRKCPRYAEVPIVAMTATIVDEQRAACLAAGMNGHLLKPVEPAVLYAKVLKWLRRVGR